MFRNVGENMLTDLSLLVTLSGSPFDFNTIRAPEGEYESGDNSIVWDWRRVGDLQLLSPNEEGKIDFWIDFSYRMTFSALSPPGSEHIIRLTSSVVLFFIFACLRSYIFL